MGGLAMQFDFFCAVNMQFVFGSDSSYKYTLSRRFFEQMSKFKRDRSEIQYVFESIKLPKQQKFGLNKQNLSSVSQDELDIQFLRWITASSGPQPVFFIETKRFKRISSGQKAKSI